jgi:hypothetical protein
MCENGMLKRIFGSKKQKMTGGWRRLHNEELRDLYTSPNTSRAIKSTRMRTAEQVARVGAKENA